MASPNGGRRARRVPAAGRLAAEFVKRELDDEDERIEVGVAIVGGGPAGLACANRLLQLLDDDPELMERLGEVPVAVIEKGKVVRRAQPVRRDDEPVGAPRAVPRRRPRTGRHYGEVDDETRLLHAEPEARAAAQADAAAVPQPRQLRRLVAELIRWLAEKAEEAGAYILTETAAHEAARRGRRRASASARATRAAARTASRWATSSPAPTSRPRRPCSPRAAGATSPAPRSSEFDLAADASRRSGRSGVKEVWEVAQAARPGHPHARLAAALGGQVARSSAARGSTR